MYCKIIRKVVILNLIIFCNCSNKETYQNKNPLLLFNEIDTLTYKNTSSYRLLQNSDSTCTRAKFYNKGYINRPDINLVGPAYRFGKEIRFVHKTYKNEHNIQLVDKDTLHEFRIVKKPWKGYDIKILDVSHPDSAFIIDVDYYNIIE